MSTDEKACSKCKEVKPLTAYHNSSKTKDGKQGVCRECALTARRGKPQTEHNKEYRRGYREKHRIRMRGYAKRRRDLRSVYPEDVLTLMELYARDNAICYICNEYTTFDDASADHVIPLSAGGPDTNDNIKLAHLSCNIRKNG